MPTISEAVELFLSDAGAQQLSGETIRKYEHLLKRRFQPWCESKGYRYLKQLGVEPVRQFRATWSDSSNYATKNLERLRAFFRFCIHDDWMAKNPARAVKAPKITDTPTFPFRHLALGAGVRTDVPALTVASWDKRPPLWRVPAGGVAGPRRGRCGRDGYAGRSERSRAVGDRAGPERNPPQSQKQ